MGAEQARAIVERFFEETWVKHDMTVWNELPEDVVFWNFGTKIEGREGWLQAFVRPLSKGFPGLRVEPEFTVAENDKVVLTVSRSRTMATPSCLNSTRTPKKSSKSFISLSVLVPT